MLGFDEGVGLTAASCLMDVVERLHEPLKDVFWSIAWHSAIIWNHSMLHLQGELELTVGGDVVPKTLASFY